MFDSCCTAKVNIVFRLAKSMLLFTTKKNRLPWQISGRTKNF
nr:MAG TPA: hypothetical protein [Crassvirales sp.]